MLYHCVLHPEAGGCAMTKLQKAPVACARCGKTCCTTKRKATTLLVSGLAITQYRDGPIDFVLCHSCGAVLMDFLDGACLDAEYEHDCNLSCKIA